MVPCSLVKWTEVSEVYNASIIRAIDIPEGCHIHTAVSILNPLERRLGGPRTGRDTVAVAENVIWTVQPEAKY
jgi:hypothetical protein